MNNKYQTEQEAFWAGEFGSGYVTRNQQDSLMLASNLKFFSDIISHTNEVESVLELGSNIGANLIALKTLKPEAELSAVEINKDAVEKLKKLNLKKIYFDSILNFEPEQKYDFVFIKGVLIHINPDALQQVYAKMYAASGKYICLAEYYSTQPTMVPYRGHQNKLFKRDFCGELMDQFPDLTLVDYGFNYRRDNNFPTNDDLTWFLLEKK